MKVPIEKYIFQSKLQWDEWQKCKVEIQLCRWSYSWKNCKGYINDLAKKGFFDIYAKVIGLEHLRHMW
jgi:hypothetical protein